MRQSSIWTLAVTVVGVAVISWLTLGPRPIRLIYNASASAPIGWYVVTEASQVRVGDSVLARLPARVAAFADRRGYLPNSVPILKRVGGGAGQWVCVQNGQISVDSAEPTRVLMRDGAGRLLNAWDGCRELEMGELFLFSDDSPASFDGRYFGPISEQLVIGRTVAVWTW